MLIVLPADRRLASKAVRKSLGIKSLRFATKDEVEQLTGLAPGSIPPFGSLFGLATWCDEGLSQQERINFNAGDHCDLDQHDVCRFRPRRVPAPGNLRRIAGRI